jgi:DNA-binding response OmpR family regulator
MSRIYIIDDDKDLLDEVKSSLRKKGFNVSTFSKWEIANEVIKHTKPQVILLDVFLSGIDGLDVCQQLKSSPYSKHIPILLFSAYPKIAESAIHDYGADDFIAKPFEVGDLVGKLHRMLSKSMPA